MPKTNSRSKVKAKSNERSIALRVNGRAVEVTVPPHRTLLEALRDAGFVDVKRGCEKGDCGACAVLLDGVAVDACLTLAWTVEGREIVTAAGLGSHEAMHPLQRTFVERGAVQCGYCTPGLIVAAQSLIATTPNPSEDDIRLGLSGNLCRCTGYAKVFEAVRDAAAEMRGARGRR
ncbi:MAG: (2Fe-2S)-binding protein [Rhodospirillales bacterium]|nr:(2Fe-2S)-binding protein [Rhodospirillales bacterium]